MSTSEERAAVATLRSLGYSYHGGTLWKPPLGRNPFYDQEYRESFFTKSGFDLAVAIEDRVAEIKDELPFSDRRGAHPLDTYGCREIYQGRVFASLSLKGLGVRDPERLQPPDTVWVDSGYAIDAPEALPAGGTGTLTLCAFDEWCAYPLTVLREPFTIGS